jgi:predicted membrane-bound mannosyltransferase
VGVWVEARAPSPHQNLATETRNPPSPISTRHLKLELVLLALIVLVALFLRVYQINTFPNGCQYDEAKNGLDALQWMNGAPYVPYADTNEGQATFFTYLIALAFKLLGVGVTQMRLVSAICATATIPVFYFLARDWLYCSCSWCAPCATVVGEIGR